MNEYLWLIPALPLLGFLLNGLLGKRLGKGFVTLVGPGVVGLAFVFSVLAFLAMLEAPELALHQELFAWIDSGNFQVPIAFTVDRLSGLYILIITGVFMCVELMLNAVNVGFIGFAYGMQSMVGVMFVFFVLVVAAAEAVVGLAIILAIFRNRQSMNIDEINLLRW